MPKEEHIGDVWAVNALHRATRVGHDVFSRAQARKIEWPIPKQHEKDPVEDPLVYTTIDDAFSTVLQFMSQTTRQCKRFYGTNPQSMKAPCDGHHCNRFHTPEYTAVQHKNPLQRSEDVHVMVGPGTYAVTAGAWGESQQQTHVVNVDQGQTVSLDFVM